MLKEIQEKYGTFPDAVIYSITYTASHKPKCKNNRVELIINCMNLLDDYTWQYVRLKFTDVIEFRFIEDGNMTNHFLFGALLQEDNGIIVADFSPLIYSGAIFKVNDKSDFIIRCEKIDYEIVNEI